MIRNVVNNSPSIIEDDKNISVYYWLYHHRKPYRNKVAVLHSPNKNVHLIIQLLLGNQVELNPGPKAPRWPCGSCGKNVTWKSKALECDSCKTWYHTDCQGGMSDSMYNIMECSNLSWHCLKCGLPNFSSSFFNTSTSTCESKNPFSVISCNDSPRKPCASSSPKPIQQEPYNKKNNVCKPQTQGNQFKFSIY